MRGPLWRVTLAAAFGHALFTSAPVQAGEEDANCSLYDEASATQLLRRLSLDLRNRLPAYEEYASVAEAGALPDGIIDEYMAGDEFRVAMRRFHETLLWPNVEGIALAVNTHRLRKDAETGLHYVAARTDTYRGGTQADLIICLDQEQKKFDGGSPVPIQGKREGFVWVKPYWSEEPIKVCAYDAQTAAKADGVDCDTVPGGTKQGCGCGPSLRFCYGPQVERDVTDDMREQLLRVVDESTAFGRPYSEILTTRRAPTTGRLNYWRRYLAHIQRIQKVYNNVTESDPIPPESKLAYSAGWHWVERPAPHAGIITLPAFTLRFQTNRGRANRFRVAFADQYFEPPSVDDTEGCNPDANDVTRRCVCRHCHTTLEPLAAHFSYVAEGGSSIIKNFGFRRAECDGAPDGSSFCNRFYATKGPGSGWLIPLQYAAVGTGAVHEKTMANAKAGPIALARATIESGVFARATVVHLFQYLIGRDPDLDPSSDDNEGATIDAIAADLQATDDFKRAVKAVASLPAYRRMR